MTIPKNCRVSKDCWLQWGACCTIYPEALSRLEYSLKELGESMYSIIETMENWGNEYKAEMPGG